MRGTTRQCPVRRWLAGGLLLLLALSGCGKEVDLHSGLSQRDANEMVAMLQRHGIAAHKQINKAGVLIRVDADRLAASVALLRENGLPREDFSRMGEIFKKDGMLSTPVEERARYLAALAQELENTLSQIEGVVLARVHPVLSEKPALGEALLPSSCAVFIKHRPGWDADAYEERIRRLVLASIPGLAAAPGDAQKKVPVVFVPAAAAQQGAAGAPNTMKQPDIEDQAGSYWPAAAIALLLVVLCLAYGLATGNRRKLHLRKKDHD